MPDQHYEYSGPTTGITLTGEDGAPREEILTHGRTPPLPPEHPQVMRLVSERLLTPVAAPATTSGKKSRATSDQENG